MNVINKNRYTALQDFGTHAMAYATLQRGLDYVEFPTFSGYIAYKKIGGYTYVLGNPVVAPGDRFRALKAFTEMHPSSIFCQINIQTARILQHIGFSIYGFGQEHWLDLEDFKITWRVRPDIKRWLSALGKTGLRVEPIEENHISLSVLNRLWRKSKKRELNFLARPFHGYQGNEVKAFILYQYNEPLGFVTFDPIFDAGIIATYELQHWRVLPQAPKGSMDFLLSQSLLMFKNQGLRRISLGLTPLFQRDKQTFKGLSWIDWVLDSIGKTNWWYHFKGLGQHKLIYKAQQIPSFLALPKSISINGLWGILRVNQLV